ncbi:MAG: prepilin-type N-terminal cleavage/methylation domain-containing protein [Elusimicrobia bacterium]|nr:prepilin-type N-terminal cleavage/methylation domain-containing protein [Elusimicrobiota bacterium]
MNRRLGRRGVTLTEMMIATALMALIAVAFASFLRYATRAVVTETNDAQGQETTRQGLQKLERALVHANEITVASSTLVEFVTDIDQSPNWNPNALDCDGVPYYRSADVDCDAATIQPSSAVWRSGFNLTDDDDDNDGQIDVVQRIYLSSGAVWRDMNLDGAGWGLRATKLLDHVSTFTLTYWGNKANALGSGIDTNGDGIISASEMDCDPNSGGNCDGALDLQVERNFITTIRVDVGVDVNDDGKTDYSVEDDVYPPLLPLKPLQQ